jgi:hypothetical protein
MLPDRQTYIQHLERTCRSYRDSIAKGEDWAQIPLEITEQWISLLRRADVTASDAADLVRRCDEHKMTKGGVAFFGMCSEIREWYRDTYQRELGETI